MKKALGSAIDNDAYQFIRVDYEETLAWLIINRPRVHNAMNSACILEMTMALEALEADPLIRVIAIIGSGEKAFTSGADISEIKEFTGIEMEPYNRRWINLFEKIERLKKPVIAAVHGWATGGGTEMSLACDFVVCSSESRFGLAEINIGVIPGAGAAIRLTRWVGRLKAKEILMLGEQISGSEAAQIGLANRCVPHDSLRDTVKEISSALSEKAPLALAAAKASVNSAAESHQTTAIEHELNEFLRLFWTQDQKEGMRAFLEKRKPKFIGK